MNGDKKKEIDIKDVDLGNKGSIALCIGVIGLIVLAVITLITSLEFIGAPSAAWGFSAWWGLRTAIPAAPWYLILGISCLVYSIRASVLYKKDLRVVGIFNVLGLGFLVIGTIFYWFMWLACVIYYGLILWWLVRRMKMRKNVFEDAQKNEEKG